jgi:hypothetical protein
MMTSNHIDHRLFALFEMEIHIVSLLSWALTSKHYAIENGTFINSSILFNTCLSRKSFIKQGIAIHSNTYHLNLVYLIDS